MHGRTTRLNRIPRAVRKAIMTDDVTRVIRNARRHVFRLGAGFRFYGARRSPDIVFTFTLAFRHKYRFTFTRRDDDGDIDACPRTRRTGNPYLKKKNLYIYSCIQKLSRQRNRYVRTHNVFRFSYLSFSSRFVHAFYLPTTTETIISIRRYGIPFRRVLLFASYKYIYDYRRTITIT